MPDVITKDNCLQGKPSLLHIKYMTTTHPLRTIATALLLAVSLLPSQAQQKDVNALEVAYRDGHTGYVKITDDLRVKFQNEEAQLDISSCEVPSLTVTFDNVDHFAYVAHDFGPTGINSVEGDAIRIEGGKLMLPSTDAAVYDTSGRILFRKHTDRLPLSISIDGCAVGKGQAVIVRYGDRSLKVVF